MDQTNSPHFKFIGRPLPRKEDARLTTGAGRFSDDFRAPAHVPCRDRSLAVSACANCQHKSRQRARDARRARHVQRCRLSPRTGLKPIPHDPVPKTKFDMRLTGAGRRHRCSSARTRCCRPTRRAMSARRWLWLSRRRSPRRSTLPRRSRWNTNRCPSCCMSEAAMAPGAPLVWDEAPDNLAGRLALWRRGCHRQRLRYRRPCGRQWTFTSAA